MFKLLLQPTGKKLACYKYDMGNPKAIYEVERKLILQRLLFFLCQRGREFIYT